MGCCDRHHHNQLFGEAHFVNRSTAGHLFSGHLVLSKKKKSQIHTVLRVSNMPPADGDVASTLCLIRTSADV